MFLSIYFVFCKFVSYYQIYNYNFDTFYDPFDFDAKQKISLQNQYIQYIQNGAYDVFLYSMFYNQRQNFSNIGIVDYFFIYDITENINIIFKKYYEKVKKNIDFLKQQQHIRFIVQNIYIWDNGGHQNFLIFDKKYQIIELIDPNTKCVLNINNFKEILELYISNVSEINIINNSVPINESTANTFRYSEKNLNTLWRKIYKNNLQKNLFDIFNIEYSNLSPLTFMKVQKIETQYDTYYINSSGYCVMWTYMYFYYRCIINPEIIDY